MSGVTSRVVISALLLLVGAANGVLCTQAALAASPE
jgi:hypothetical protein